MRVSWIATVAVTGIVLVFAAREAVGQSRLAGVTDSAGIKIVRAETSTSVRSVKLVFRSDSVLPASAVLERITAVVESSSGEVFAVDRRAANIKVFTKSGHFDRTLGARGQGPGEFVGPLNQLWMRGVDTIFVPDPGNGRVQLIDRLGRWLASWPLPAGELGAIESAPDGRTLAFYLTRVPGSRPGRLSPRVEVFELSPRAAARLGEVDTGGEASLASPSSRPAIDVSGASTLWLADPTRFEVRSFDAALRLRLILRRSELPATLREGDLDVLLEHSTLAERREGSARMMHSMLVRSARSAFPPAYASVSKLFVDDSGRIWIGRHTSSADILTGVVAAFEIDNPVGSEWEVFGPSGASLFRVRLPASFRLSSVHKDALLGYELDDEYGPRIVKLVLVP